MRRKALGLCLCLGLTPGCATTRVPAPAPAEASRAAPAGTIPDGRAAVDLPPARSARVCLRAAEVMEDRGLPIDAIAQYEKARGFDPKLPGVARRLAVLYDRQGDFVRATAEYKLALEATPNDPALLNDMGYYCYERGEWPEAERWLRKAVAADPKAKRAWVNLGLALAQQGRADESLAAFGRVLTPSQARANLGLIQAQVGRRDEAAASLREAVRLEPDSEITRAVLDRLERPGPAAGAVAAPGTRVSAN